VGLHSGCLLQSKGIHRQQETTAAATSKPTRKSSGTELSDVVHSDSSSLSNRPKVRTGYKVEQARNALKQTEDDTVIVRETAKT